MVPGGRVLRISREPRNGSQGQEIEEEPGNQACVAEANRQRKACILTCI